MDPVQPQQPVPPVQPVAQPIFPPAQPVQQPQPVQYPQQPVQYPQPAAPVYAPQQPQAAQPVQKKKSNALVIILVIIGIALVACCAVGGGLMLFANGYKDKLDEITKTTGTPTASVKTPTTAVTTTAPTPSVSTSGLSKVTTTAYTFYYPTTFTSKPNGSAVQSYQSTKANSLGLYNTIKLISTDMPADTEDIPNCSDYADELTTSAFTDIVAQGNTVTALGGTSVSRGGMIGCDMQFSISGAKVSYLADLSFVYKRSDTKLYILGVSYDSVTSSEYTALQNAKRAFIVN